jgi:tellurite methyltransferase
MKNDLTREQYNEKYRGESFYWSTHPSKTSFEVLKHMPPKRHLRLLDIGCGEGRNAVFFARNGYEVHAYDLSEKGLEKTARLAQQAGVSIHTFQADFYQFRLTEPYDIIFSTGTLHFCDQSVRTELFENLKAFTSEGGINVFSIFVKKPFIPPPPDADAEARPWRSGELLTLYHDWKIESFTEEIFDCMSSGVPHQHAVNRMVARKETSQQSLKPDAE